VFQGYRLQRSGSGNDGSCYDYDAFGNLIRERRGLPPQVTEYTYDSQHRLIGVSSPDGKSVSYRYDAFGRRIQKIVDGYTTQYFWQDDRLIAESGPRHYRSYIYESSESSEPGSFRPLALLDGKGRAHACPYYFQLDHLGTPQELTGHGGAIVWSAQYSAHGKLRESSRERLEQPLRFQGHYFDAESGLHYNRHRYYHPDFGRFLTPDPLRPGGGLNPYRYTRNPTGWVDPLGSGDPLGSTRSGSIQAPDVLTAASK
jgi:RHS repeat-associated protein